MGELSVMEPSVSPSAQSRASVERRLTSVNTEESFDCRNCRNGSAGAVRQGIVHSNVKYRLPQTRTIRATDLVSRGFVDVIDLSAFAQPKRSSSPWLLIRGTRETVRVSNADRSRPHHFKRLGGRDFGGR